MTDIRMISDDSAVTVLISRAPGGVRVATRQALEDASTFILARVKVYPQQRPGSSYVRTHTLEKSWSRKVDASNMSATVGSSGNIAPYNRSVMDRDRQASIHRGRWTPAQTIAEQSEPRVARMFEDRIRAAISDR